MRKPIERRIGARFFRIGSITCAPATVGAAPVPALRAPAPQGATGAKSARHKQQASAVRNGQGRG